MFIQLVCCFLLLLSACTFKKQTSVPKPSEWAAKLKALPVSNPQPLKKRSNRLTTLLVTLSTDNNPGGMGDSGDLRHAINTMNQDLSSVVDDYAITFSHPMTIQLNGILPMINNSSNPVNITIGNSGSTPTVTIDGNSGAYGGFFIPIGDVTIQNIAFQNMTARGGNGGNGIAGGGGGLGAGGAIYAPQSFLNGSNPTVTLLNVTINNCAAIGGNGGDFIGNSCTGNEGGGGGGGFSGNGGSVTTFGVTGGGGGGGFGGDGGAVTLDTGSFDGGGGGGGGGLGSRATIGTLTNLGHGGADANAGLDGNGQGLSVTAGSGGGGAAGGQKAGGGGGGGAISAFVQSGGGGGGSSGTNGSQGQGGTPPGSSVTSSGGSGGDGAGGGGGGVVVTSITNGVDGSPGTGGYGGGGGGGAGTGAYDSGYTVAGGRGGIGGGGGGGGADSSGSTSAAGGNSQGGGGGGGGGPSNSSAPAGGTDIGSLGGGAGGEGANTFGSGVGGGGGGGGSGLGGAIFVDSNLNFHLRALSGVATTFNTPNNSTQAGNGGTGSFLAQDGSPGSSLGESIFLRSGSTLTMTAYDADDELTVGSDVKFIDDTSFGAGGTNVMVTGNGTVNYSGTSTYEGSVKIDNANFKVDGQINQAGIYVCRNSGFSSQRGKLSGAGTLTGNVFANSGAIFPGPGATLTLGSLTLNSAGMSSLGSLVHSDIDSSGGTSLVAVTGAVTLAGILELNIDSNAQLGTYTLLTSSGITGTFDSVTFTNATPSGYTVSYLPVGSPTYVQLNITSMTNKTSASGSGTFTSGGHEIQFKSTAGYNSNNQIVASLFYHDAAADVHFDNPVVTSQNFSGNQVTLSGTVKVKGQKQTFTYILTDNTSPTPDTISLSLGGGYSASGNLNSGDVTIQ